MQKPRRACAALFCSLALTLSAFTGCATSQPQDAPSPTPEAVSQTSPTPAPTQAPDSLPEEEASSSLSLAGLAFTGAAELRYAKQFTVDHFEGGFVLLTVEDGSRYLTVPQGQEPPEGLDEDIVVLRQPLSDVYLTATAAMCFFEALGRGEAIRFSGTQAEDWSVAYAQQVDFHLQLLDLDLVGLGLAVPVDQGNLLPGAYLFALRPGDLQDTGLGGEHQGLAHHQPLHGDAVIGGIGKDLRGFVGFIQGVVGVGRKVDGHSGGQCQNNEGDEGFSLFH